MEKWRNRQKNFELNKNSAIKSKSMKNGKAMNANKKSLRIRIWKVTLFVARVNVYINVQLIINK